MAQTDIVPVPYEGTWPAVIDLMAGQITFMFTPMLSVIDRHKTGKLCGLAVSGAKRPGVLPNILTIAEAGVTDYEIVAWNAIMTPRGVPPSIGKRPTDEITASFNYPALKDEPIAQKAEPEISTPDELATPIKTELARYAKLVHSARLIAQ